MPGPPADKVVADVAHGLHKQNILPWKKLQSFVLTFFSMRQRPSCQSQLYLAIVPHEEKYISIFAGYDAW